MDPIAAISSANSSSAATDRAQQCNDQLDMNNLQACGMQTPNPTQAPGANLTLAMPVVEPPAQMNVVSTAHVFQDRLTNGFYMKEMHQLLNMAGNPDISAGEKTAILLDVQERVGLAKVVQKVAERLVDGLQTVVTKSG
jgi:hypothetical protein